MTPIQATLSPPRPARTNPRPSSHTDKLTLTYLRLTSGWVLILYWLAMLTLLHWPMGFRTETRVAGIWLDNIAHALLYAPLAWLLIGFLGNRLPLSFWRDNRLWLAPAILLAAAAIDEWTQPLTGRTAALGDWIGDGVGIGLVTLLVWLTRVVVRGRTVTPAAPETPDGSATGG